jgi:hypothetical protein
MSSKMLPRNKKKIGYALVFKKRETEITAGDCDEKSSHAGHNLAIEFQKAAELRFLVLPCYQLISNLNKTMNLTHFPELMNYL